MMDRDLFKTIERQRFVEASKILQQEFPQGDDFHWELYENWRQARNDISPREFEMEKSRIDGQYYLGRIVPSQLKYGFLESSLDRQTGEELTEMFFFGLTDLSDKSTGAWGDGGRYWWRDKGGSPKFWYLGSRDWRKDAPVRHYLHDHGYRFKPMGWNRKDEHMNSFWLWRWGEELLLSDTRKHFNFFIVSNEVN